MSGTASIGTELRQATAETITLARVLVEGAREIFAEARALCAKGNNLQEEAKARKRLLVSRIRTQVV